MSSSQPLNHPPFTPEATTVPTSKQAPPSSTTARRSARVHKRDPVIAPGFGTQQDLKQLAQDLGVSTEIVQTIMASQGRGYTRRSRGATEEETKPAVVSTAWADFLSEADPAAVAPADDMAAGTSGKKRGKPAAEDNLKETARTYELPLVASWSKSQTKKKKAKSDAQGGILVQAGTLNASIIGRSKPVLDKSFDLVLPSVLTHRIRFTKVISSCNAAHALAIAEDGHVYGWGRNEANQLGSGIGTNVARPFLLSLEGTIVDGAVGKSHSIVLDVEHQLWAVGSNKLGQLGIKSSVESAQNFRKCALDSIVVQISCGEAFSVALDEDGYIYTTGSSEFGQLGNGETGEYFISANKLAFSNSNTFTKQSVFVHAPGEKLYTASNKDVKIVPLEEDIRIGNIACGKHHCIAIEAPSNSPPRVFSWGCGNYGCLGHGVQSDEYRPRLIGTLNAGNIWKSNPPIFATAGASCSMILTKSGHVYYWGKHRSVGEAVMRPQLLAELANNGHVASYVAAGAQTVVISTQNAVTVAWGQGPHGELGLDDGKKSSAKPVFVTKLDRCRIQDLACGYGTTYYLVKSEDKDDEAAIKNLPTVSDEAFIELEKTMASQQGEE